MPPPPSQSPPTYRSRTATDASPPRRRRSSHVNHPAKSFALFVLVLVLAGLAYEFVHVRRIFDATPEAFISGEMRETLRDRILERYTGDVCFLELGEILYRPKENAYRVEFRVADGCETRARRVCEEIAALVGDATEFRATVWALDGAGNTVAHFVP
jgi:hypothetical protein